MIFNGRENTADAPNGVWPNNRSGTVGLNTRSLKLYQ